jgi:fused signal recognition particle receptor
MAAAKPPRLRNSLIFLKKEGKKVLLAAGDTFRAGAIDQLSIWADKIGVEIVKAQSGSDPSSVAFDALTAAKSRGMDVGHHRHSRTPAK